MSVVRRGETVVTPINSSCKVVLAYVALRQTTLIGIHRTAAYLRYQRRFDFRGREREVPIALEGFLRTRFSHEVST